MKQFEHTLLHQIKTIERQNKEIERFKIPKPTPKASPVEKTSNYTADITTEINIKCNECSFTGRTNNDVKEHKRTACSEALIQRIIEEDSERREDTDFLEEGSETSDCEEEWIQQGRHQKSFECPICGLTRKTKIKLEQHMRGHDKAEEDSQFTCDQCSYQTINRDQYTEHMERAHSQRKFTCTCCNRKFKTKQTFNKHNKEVHRTSYNPCRNFPLNKCEYDVECNFYHVILNQGQHICYKCGEKSDNKTIIMSTSYLNMEMRNVLMVKNVSLSIKEQLHKM